MTFRAVLFDFSGTLFRLEDESWLPGTGDGDRLDVSEQAELMRRMTAPAEQVVQLAPEFQHAWHNRDLDPALHRKVYLEVLRVSGVDDPEQAQGLYGRLVDPDCWTPYPDTAGVLRDLRAKGVLIGVISNIAFDIKPAFDRLGVRELVDDFVLSYEEGVVKPDARIFRLSCERLGVAPEDALMIGDSVEADGGAKQLGSAVRIVDPLPTAQRPDELRSALVEHGVL